MCLYVNPWLVAVQYLTFFQVALLDFVQKFVSTDDFTDTILPTMEKALLRSPEYSLHGMYRIISSNPLLYILLQQ
jgi:hypothetical protein